MIIQDISLSPYCIEINQNSFNVGKMVKSTDKKTGKEKESFNADTYHNNIENAILKVAFLKTLDVDAIMTLNEYIISIQKVKEEIKKTITI